MKISKEEQQKYYKSSEPRGFDWMNMDTGMAKEYSDERLLGLISASPLVECAGFGLVAELCKRFNESE